jgi:16S rRNA (uracil1498-N3)-methyltransferase
MPDYDFTGARLFVEAPLVADEAVTLEAPQAHYLLNVLRLGSGAKVLAFNGRDGEWLCAVETQGKRAAALRPAEQTRPQPTMADLHYLFAPLKHARLDYMVQKAVEMGASALCPVITRHTQVARVNLERMRANAIEAAEQCGVLAVPEIVEPVAFEALLAGFDPERLLVFCDEGAEEADASEALRMGRANLGGNKLAVLIGPEGGFAPAEREALRRMTNVVRISLGPRILRADTAAVAALTIVQATLGDW